MTSCQFDSCMKTHQHLYRMYTAKSIKVVSDKPKEAKARREKHDEND